MGIINKLAKSGMLGAAGLAATNKGAVNDIARHGGFGLFGKLLSKKREEDFRPQISGGPVADDSADRAGMGDSTDRAGMGDSKRMVSKAKGGSVKKMAKGGSTASKRADGCAIKGKTKGRFV